jgi:hypothetical protein
MAEEGEFLNRRGVYPPLKDAEKARLVQIDELGGDGLKRKMREYHKIFYQ